MPKKTSLEIDSSNYHPLWCCWGGEASLRVHGIKMKPTTIPDAEWDTVQKAAEKFWDEIAAESKTKAKAIDIQK